MIFYPQCFQDEVKRLIPEAPYLMEAMRKGENIDRALLRYVQIDMSPEEIVKAFEEVRAHEVLQAAKIAVERRGLYHKFMMLEK